MRVSRGRRPRVCPLSAVLTPALISAEGSVPAAEPGPLSASAYLSAAAAAVELSRRRRHLRRTREAAAECCPRWRRVVAIVAAGKLLGSSGLGLFDIGCPRAVARSDDRSGAGSAAGGSSHQSECLCDTPLCERRFASRSGAETADCIARLPAWKITS